MANSFDNAQRSATYREVKKPCKMVEKLDLLYQHMGRLSKHKTFKAIFNELPSMFESLFTFNKFSIIVPNTRHSSPLTAAGHRLSTRKVFHGNTWLQILFADSCPCSDPQFRDLSQLSAGRKT